MKAHPLLGEVVGVVLQMRTHQNVSNSQETTRKCSLEMQTTYNFHALSAWRLRDGVLDETVRGKGLRRHRKCH